MHLNMLDYLHLPSTYNKLACFPHLYLSKMIFMSLILKISEEYSRNIWDRDFWIRGTLIAFCGSFSTDCIFIWFCKLCSLLLWLLLAFWHVLDGHVLNKGLKHFNAVHSRTLQFKSTWSLKHKFLLSRIHIPLLLSIFGW